MDRLAKWRNEYARQKKEHPALPNWAIKRIASDHMKLRRKAD